MSAVPSQRRPSQKSAVPDRPLSMTRGVSQLLFSYLPGRTVDWEGGLAVVRLGSVRLETAWSDERAGLVLAEVGRRLRDWRQHGGTVDESFPDPVNSADRFTIGEPKSIDAVPLESALKCRACGRLDFRRLGAGPGGEQPKCLGCGKSRLRQLGYVFVHGCGELVPLQEWLPRSKLENGVLRASSMPLRCRVCPNGGRPEIPGRIERIRDLRVVCGACRAVIVERVTARCSRCIAKLKRPEGQSEDDFEKHIVPRILMRMTNYQANEAYYPQTFSLLRLGRPRIVAEDSALVRDLRGLLPGDRRPAAATKGARIMAIARQIAAAEERGDTSEVERLSSQLASVNSAPEVPPDTSASAPGLQDDVVQGVEEALALLTEVTTESFDHVMRRAGGEWEAKATLIRDKMAQLGVTEVKLVRDLPMITSTFGYTRRSFEPTYEELGVPGIPVAIRPFYPLDRGAAQRLGQMEREGTTPILARESEHEGVLITLDLARVASWLGLPAARAEILKRLEAVDRYHDGVLQLGHRRMLFGLLHSLAHSAMRSVSRLAGLERTSIGEHLFLPLPGFVIYANAGPFNLGVMELVVRDHLLAFFNDFATTALDCVHDPACIDKKGACVGCIHAPEVACRFFNHGLSRAFVIGGHEPWADAASDGSVRGFWQA